MRGSGSLCSRPWPQASPWWHSATPPSPRPWAAAGRAHRDKSPSAVAATVHEFLTTPAVALEVKEGRAPPHRAPRVTRRSRTSPALHRRSLRSGAGPSTSRYRARSRRATAWRSSTADWRKSSIGCLASESRSTPREGPGDYEPRPEDLARYAVAARVVAARAQCATFTDITASRCVLSRSISSLHKFAVSP